MSILVESEMNFLKRIARNFLTKEQGLIKFGQVNAICPYCEKALSKFPGKKARCKSCSNFIYVRTRPLDSKRILLKDSELLLCEEQWSIKNGVWNEFKAQQDEIEEIREQKRKAYGFEPPEGDVQWALLNNRSIEYAAKHQWGLYRNNQFQMAEQLSFEGRPLHALHHLSVVMMFDINGAMNCGERPLDNPTENWNVDLGFLAPGVISRYEKQANIQGYDINKCQEIFIEANQPYIDGGYNMPLSINDAWDKVQQQLDIN